MSRSTPITARRVQETGERDVATWLLPDGVEPRQLLEEMGQFYGVHPEPKDSAATTWFDSFDWRLYSHGLLLCHDRRSWQLLRRDRAEVVAVLAAPGGARWRFCLDFPTGRVRSLLEPVLANRRLLLLFASRSSTEGCRIVNGDGKTVARVEVATHHLGKNGPVVRTLRVQGLKGYGRDFVGICDLLCRYGVTDRLAPFQLFALGVRAAGRTPLDYSTRFRPSLQPEMTARQAVVSVFQELRAVMQRNEPGVLQDLDPEFLHDFRVALRRTRSGLGLVRKVLPAAAVQVFRAEFAWLGKVTGPVRDLDVFLEAEPDLLARLPLDLRGAFGPFFTELRRQRARAITSLRRGLRSKRYAALVTAWEAFLAGGGAGEETEDSERPVPGFARRVIRRRFRRLLAVGADLGPDSPAAAYHRLRIEGKKLRYTLEFFSVLFPQKAVEAAVSHLKQLQDNLGTSNDLAVQQETLRARLAVLPPGSRKSLAEAAAIGGLLVSLRGEQERLRSDFAGCFADFSRPGHTELYTKHCRR